MNWREIFKRTAIVLIAATLINFTAWWNIGSKLSIDKTYLLAAFITWGVLVWNLINMAEFGFVNYYFRHVRWVIFMSFLGSLPLAFYLFGISSEYINLCISVMFFAFVGAVIYHFIHVRELSRGNLSHYLTPEQAVYHLGEPKEVINSPSGTEYFYENVKIFAPQNSENAIGGGKIVEKIPPPLPDSIRGFSPEQIVNRLGFPKKVINLNSKIIYFYKDMKIIFIDGEVADIL